MVSMVIVTVIVDVWFVMIHPFLFWSNPRPLLDSLLNQASQGEEVRWEAITNEVLFEMARTR